MSNRAYIVRTKFEGITDGDVSYGVRVYDDYESYYNNNFEGPPTADDIELFKTCLEQENEEQDGVLSFVVEEHKGCYIDDNWYTWEQLSAAADSEEGVDK